MGPAPRTSTTRLPASLREQIGQEPSEKTQRHKSVISRKLARKQERTEQKQRKAAFFSRPKGIISYEIPKRRSGDHLEERPKKKSRTLSETSSIQAEVPLTENFLSSKSLPRTNSLISKDSEVLRPKAGPSSKLSPRKPVPHLYPSHPNIEDPEIAEIAWLESKLGIVGRKDRKKRALRFADGLDDLMDDLDRIIPTNEHTLTTSELETQDDLEDSEFQGFSVAIANEGSIDHISNDLTEAHTSNSQEKISNEEIESATIESKPREVNAIALYETTPIAQTGRYIPPHLRPASSDGSESLSKLFRQVKGLLNRLSEHNIASILISIEQLYQTHRRNDISSTLTNLIIEGISSHSSLLDSFVVLYASLVASVHKIIGLDFVAHFIQSLVTCYEQHYYNLRSVDSDKATNDENKGKECLNLMVLLSELYNLQVISCVLIYDLIRVLLDRLDEFDVELLLKATRNSGQQLRQDDTSALKDIVQTVQAKMSQKEKSAISSRTHFMLETLVNLKNGKVKRIAGQEGHAGSLERMRKFLSGLSKKHHVLAQEPLRVTLDDLHSSAKKGKWWLVGSGWGGDPLVDKARVDNEAGIQKDPAKQPSDDLLQLARKQGMNTDIRRSIFVVLLSSDDYIDACERLSQLNLTEVQQREIVRVLLHCLGNEKLYNPYYTLVIQQLCEISHSNKVTLQFCLWDFLRDIGEKSVGGAEIINSLPNDDIPVAFVKKASSTRLENTARAYAWWIAKGCSSLMILKPVDFTVLQPQSRIFFRTLFLQLFVSSQVLSPIIAPDDEAAEHLAEPHNRGSLEEIFTKVTHVPTLTQGLIYFLTTTLSRGDEPGNVVVARMLKWAREVARETLRTGKDVLASLPQSNL